MISFCPSICLSAYPSIHRSIDPSIGVVILLFSDTDPFQLIIHVAVQFLEFIDRSFVSIPHASSWCFEHSLKNIPKCFWIRPSQCWCHLCIHGIRRGRVCTCKRIYTPVDSIKLILDMSGLLPRWLTVVACLRLLSGMFWMNACVFLILPVKRVSTFETAFLYRVNDYSRSYSERERISLHLLT